MKFRFGSPLANQKLLLHTVPYCIEVCLHKRVLNLTEENCEFDGARDNISLLLELLSSNSRGFETLKAEAISILCVVIWALLAKVSSQESWAAGVGAI